MFRVPDNLQLVNGFLIFDNFFFFPILQYYVMIEINWFDIFYAPCIYFVYNRIQSQYRPLRPASSPKATERNRSPPGGSGSGKATQPKKKYKFWWPTAPPSAATVYIQTGLSILSHFYINIVTLEQDSFKCFVSSV